MISQRISICCDWFTDEYSLLRQNYMLNNGSLAIVEPTMSEVYAHAYSLYGLASIKRLFMDQITHNPLYILLRRYNDIQLIDLGVGAFRTAHELVLKSENIDQFCSRLMDYHFAFNNRTLCEGFIERLTNSCSYNMVKFTEGIILSFKDIDGLTKIGEVNLVKCLNSEIKGFSYKLKFFTVDCVYENGVAEITFGYAFADKSWSMNIDVLTLNKMKNLFHEILIRDSCDIITGNFGVYNDEVTYHVPDPIMIRDKLRYIDTLYEFYTEEIQIGELRVEVVEVELTPDDLLIAKFGENLAENVQKLIRHHWGFSDELMLSATKFAFQKNTGACSNLITDKYNYKRKRFCHDLSYLRCKAGFPKLYYTDNKILPTRFCKLLLPNVLENQNKSMTCLISTSRGAYIKRRPIKKEGKNPWRQTAYRNYTLSKEFPMDLPKGAVINSCKQEGIVLDPGLETLTDTYLAYEAKTALDMIEKRKAILCEKKLELENEKASVKLNNRKKEYFDNGIKECDIKINNILEISSNDKKKDVGIDELKEDLRSIGKRFYKDVLIAKSYSAPCYNGIIERLEINRKNANCAFKPQKIERMNTKLAKRHHTPCNFSDSRIGVHKGSYLLKKVLKGSSLICDEPSREIKKKVKKRNGEFTVVRKSNTKKQLQKRERIRIIDKDECRDKREERSTFINESLNSSFFRNYYDCLVEEEIVATEEEKEEMKALDPAPLDPTPDVSNIKEEEKPKTGKAVKKVNDIFQVIYEEGNTDDLIDIPAEEESESVKRKFGLRHKGKFMVLPKRLRPDSFMAVFGEGGSIYRYDNCLKAAIGRYKKYLNQMEAKKVDESSSSETKNSEFKSD